MVSYDTGEERDSSKHHSTKCSGVVGAVKDDSICGVGVANECNLGSE